jgi:hypothetical protein
MGPVSPAHLPTEVTSDCHTLGPVICYRLWSTHHHIVVSTVHQESVLYLSAVLFFLTPSCFQQRNMYHSKQYCLDTMQVGAFAKGIQRDANTRVCAYTSFGRVENSRVMSLRGRGSGVCTCRHDHWCSVPHGRSCAMYYGEGNTWRSCRTSGVVFSYDSNYNLYSNVECLLCISSTAILFNIIPNL